MEAVKFAKRRAQLLRKEAKQPERWWWLSFCDPSKPAGMQFLGAVLLKAPGFVTAIEKAHQLGINPGGEVGGWELPDSAVEFSCHAYKLLSKEYIDNKLGGVVKSDGSKA